MKSNTLASLLLLIFITLKLCNVINWPWLWVLSPVWISAGLAVVWTIVFLALNWDKFK